jgi:putative ABC transport system permease protein
MFFTYLRRELLRRMRQAIFISLGLALGIGLVITVTAASNGVKNSQTDVLHSLYGVATDITVTKAPASGQTQSIGIGIRQQVKSEVKGGSSLSAVNVNVNQLLNSQYSTLTSAQLARVAALHDVTAAVGGLSLVDGTVTGTIPAASIGKGQGKSIDSNLTESSFTVDGVDLTHTQAGPLSAAKITSGTRLTAADANADDALVDSGYAAQNRLHVGGTVDVGGTNFKITGMVSVPQSGSPPNVYVPLAKAQALGKTGTASLAHDVNTIYVTAASAADISAIQARIGQALPGATVTDQNNLANEVTGSLSSASSLANDLGKWLSVAVLIAAFLVASLLTMAAVARRVREFGTLKALGWRSRRIIVQVMGESIAIGIVGGAIGVGVGYAGAALIDKLAPPLSATVGPNNAASVANSPASSKLSNAFSAINETAHTVSVKLTASVTIDIVLLAVVLAVAGGLIAGSFGGWRAARLRPAAALARVE